MLALTSPPVGTAGTPLCVRQNNQNSIMRKSIVRVVGALAAVAALTSVGCGRSTTTEATGGGGERTGTVGIAMPTK